ncbi:MAG: antibiotic biosynthesis monooxygenase [Merismopedia sp. SIO2A8]|nr:antibiotic biosynthesis monooxygenase [Merismopedia sp. SIO2A8]
MSDFQDFLTRRCAHVALGEFKPGKFEEARSLYEEATSTYADGFEGAYLLREPGTDQGISIILWDSVEQMDANQHTDTHDAILRKMAPLFSQQPETRYYEVVCHIEPGQTPNPMPPVMAIH